MTDYSNMNIWYITIYAEEVQGNFPNRHIPCSKDLDESLREFYKLFPRHTGNKESDQFYIIVDGDYDKINGLTFKVLRLEDNQMIADMEFGGDYY